MEYVYTYKDQNPPITNVTTIHVLVDVQQEAHTEHEPCGDTYAPIEWAADWYIKDVSVETVNGVPITLDRKLTAEVIKYMYKNHKEDIAEQIYYEQ